MVKGKMHETNSADPDQTASLKQSGRPVAQW